MKKLSLVSFLFILTACVSLPQRERAYTQVKQAESMLNKAQGLEAPVYAPETYLEAQLLIRKAKAFMNAEQYGDARSLAEKASKTGSQACKESQDESLRVKVVAERLILKTEEIWGRYDKGEEKKYIPEALVEISMLLHDARASLENAKYMEALDLAQECQLTLASLPAKVEKGRARYLEEEQKKLQSRQDADTMIKTAQHKADLIVEDARKKAGQILIEAQVAAARARLEELERLYPSTYKVKKGETIADIAQRREIFNDQYMWPLLYKANRDQMRDPKVVFPEQVLAIPRDLSFDEIIAARREAAAPPPYIPPADAYHPEFYRRYLMIQPARQSAAAAQDNETGRNASRP